MIRVLLAEDQAMVLGALAALLEIEPDIEVVGRARNGRGSYPNDVRRTRIGGRYGGQRCRQRGLNLAFRRQSALEHTFDEREPEGQRGAQDQNRRDQPNQDCSILAVDRAAHCANRCKT